MPAPFDPAMGRPAVRAVRPGARRLLPALSVAALLLAASHPAHAQAVNDCAGRAYDAGELAKRRDKPEAQDAATAAYAAAITRGAETNEAGKQALRARIADTARVVWTLPRLAPPDVALVLRLACGEGRLTPERITALATAAEACATENPAQTAPQRNQCVWVKGGAVPYK